MGFKDLFKSNFTRIAENTTKYYLELKNNYGDRFGDEASLLATSGVLDAQNYVFAKSPKLSIQDLLNMAAISVETAEESKTLEEENALPHDQLALVEFVVTLEIELFTIDTPFLSRLEITKACYKKTETIVSTVNKTLERYTSDKLFALATTKFMESPEFQPFRKELGIIG